MERSLAAWMALYSSPGTVQTRVMLLVGFDECVGRADGSSRRDIGACCVEREAIYAYPRSRSPWKLLRPISWSARTPRCPSHSTPFGLTSHVRTTDEPGMTTARTKHVPSSRKVSFGTINSQNQLREGHEFIEARGEDAGHP
jgi:hypothetical protein